MAKHELTNMSDRLITSLATTPALAELFSDESVLRAMLDFEAALARAEAYCGIIPAKCADAIVAAAQPVNFDACVLADAAFRAGTPAIPLVKMLIEKVRAGDPQAAGFVHWGATSQDVADTAISLLLRRAQPIVSGDLRRLEKSLRDLSERHKDSVMLGRTLLQPAPPVTFGLKVAGWLAAIRRGKQDFEGALQAAGVLQFGGASGTLASLGDRGIEVREALNRELGFESPTGASALAAPWHTQRDRMGTFICACGVLTGSLGKMARDISLLMQHEVAEVFEPGGVGRGGSSTMPNKRNPTACSLTLAAAQRVPGLVATYLSTMVQEHERGLGGWQAEWPVVAAVVQSTGVAAVSMAEVAEGLVVDKEKMRADLGNTRGVIFAERAMMILGAKVGRDEAHKILQAASQRVNQQHSLSAVLAAMPEVTAHLSAAELADLETPENYLGSAELFRKSLLAESAPEKSARHERESHEQEK